MDFLPPDVCRAIRDMGAGAQPEINKATKAMFAPLLESLDGTVETLDIPYGDHARQKLDVYSAPELKDAPVVIYIPGGGFTGGDKRQDEKFFGNVGRFFAKRGVVAVTGNYRLAPEFTWPSASEDVARIVAWVKGAIAEFGGDPARIVIFGHSAGASHVASYVFDPVLRGHEEVCGAVLSSGLYVLRASEMRPNVVQYFGSDETNFERRSSVSHVAGTKIPVLLTVAEYDPVPLATPTFELAIALTRRDGHPPRLMRLDDHNHYSCICSLGTSDTRYSSAVLEFVREVTGGRLHLCAAP
jgi:acetyl esterase/lipase